MHRVSYVRDDPREQASLVAKPETRTSGRKKVLVTIPAKFKAAENLATMPQEGSSLVTDSEIKLLGPFATSKPSIPGTPAAIDADSKHSTIVHDTGIQDKTHDALPADRRAAGQRHLTTPRLSTSPSTSPVSKKRERVCVALRKEFHLAHRFWPSQTLDAAYWPEEWTPELLRAFNQIPKHIRLAPIRELLHKTIDERADRSPDEPRVVITPDVTTVLMSGSWSSPVMFPNGLQQAPTPVSASSVWSPPCSSRGADDDPEPPYSPPVTPLRIPPSPPSAVNGDVTATSTAKRTLVSHSDQASAGPASRTKRRRIANGGPNEDCPDDGEVKQSDKASLPDHYGVHTPPNETSRDEENLSPKRTVMQPEAHLKDELTPTTDQAGGTALAGMDTPRSTVRASGTRLFRLNEASLSALSSTSAAPAVDHEFEATIDSMIASLPDLTESTLERAILSLRPQQLLTTTCIELLMNTFDSGEMRILDPAYIDCENPGPKPLSGKSQAKDLLIPLYHPAGLGHWTLATVVSNKTAYLYDSCASRRTSEKVCKALETFCNSQAPAAASQPKLELLDCKCPQQDNDNDCGIFVLVAALHIMANELVPDNIDTQSWRHIFQAALDETMPVPNITLPSPAELGEYYSQMHGKCDILRTMIEDTANAISNRKGETAQNDPENLRWRVELVQSAIKVMESRLTTARKACKVLESLADKRKHLHASMLIEEGVWVENCALLEGTLDTYSALKYRQTTAQESLDHAIADARNSRTAASERVQRSSERIAAIGRATTRARQFCEQHKHLLEVVCIDRSALQADLLVKEGEVQQKTEEYLRFLQALGKECAVPKGPSSG